MHHAPDVTVVTPTFHREAQVVEAVQSALSQRGPTVEVIVLDDSAEGSARAPIAALGDARVRYVARSVPSGGRPARVRQEGLALARGELVHFLDDDDILIDGALAALAAALEGAPKIGVALGGIAPFGGDAASLAHERAYFATAAELGRKARTRFDLAACLLFKNAPLVCSACLVRRSLGLRIGWDASLPYYEDADFYLRAIRDSGFVYVDRSIVRYRTGAPSLMNEATRRRDAVLVSYRLMHAKYRRAHGTAELWALRALARVL